MNLPKYPFKQGSIQFDLWAGGVDEKKCLELTKEIIHISQTNLLSPKQITHEFLRLWEGTRNDIAKSYVLDFDGPVPSKKNQLRVNKFGSKYYLTEYLNWEKWVAMYGLAHFQNKYGMSTDHYFLGPLKMTLEIWPKDRRRDTLNGMAGVADALEGVFYKNDRQIVDDRTIFMGVDKENPHFRVTIGVIDDKQGRMF